MYPTLGHLLSDIFNSNITLPIPTYGTMMALAFIAAYLVIRHELNRKEKQGLIPLDQKEEIVGKPATATELFISAAFGFLIGYKFLAIFIMPEQVSDSLQDFMFSLKGSWIAGILFALLFALFNYIDKEKKKLKEPKKQKVAVHAREYAGTFLLIAALAGIAGAKIFHQLENWQEFLADPLGSLFSSGGLTFFGGLIFGALAVVWYGRKKHIKIPYIMDIAAPAIVLAYAIGRIGCMTAGDGCWGVVNTQPQPEWLSFLPQWMWAFDYPHNVINEGIKLHSCQGNYCHVLEQPVFPTPFYETTMNLIIFLGLWISRKKIKAHGVLFSIFLVFHGLARFLIEKIRVNNTYHIGNYEITQAEIIAVVLIMLGIAGIIFFQKKHKKNKAYGT